MAINKQFKSFGKGSNGSANLTGGSSQLVVLSGSIMNLTDVKSSTYASNMDLFIMQLLMRRATCHSGRRPLWYHPETF